MTRTNIIKIRNAKVVADSIKRKTILEEAAKNYKLNKEKDEDSKNMVPRQI